jgi:hypothetical protein
MLYARGNRTGSAAALVGEPKSAWQSVSLSEMSPDQCHVAEIGSEEDVSDRAGQGYGADQRIQTDITHHAQQCAGGYAQFAGFPDDIRGDNRGHCRPDAWHQAHQGVSTKANARARDPPFAIKQTS